MTPRSPVRRAARVLSLLARETGLTASDVSRRLELPYATCHRLLGTLAEEAMIRRETGKRYSLAALH